MQQRLLEEVNRNVRRLADFKNWLNADVTRATFTSPEDLRSEVLSALHLWRDRHESAAPRKRRRGERQDPSAYLRSLLAETAFIDIRGFLVGSEKAHRFPIDDLYVTLTTAAAPESDKAEPKERQKEIAREMRQAVPLEGALAQRRLVILGDPGSGKTTFLHRIAHALCETRLGDDRSAAKEKLGLPDAPFPIYLQVGRLAEHIAKAGKGDGVPTQRDSIGWIPHFLASESTARGWGLHEEYFRDAIGSDDAIVLLDGLDEAPDRVARESLSELIGRLADANGARIVVTSRPAAYEGEAVLPDFTMARIDPLSSGAIKTFIDRWCAALHPEGQSRADAHCQELLEALASRVEIRRLARSPVMLTALAVVHWNERRLPEQRAELYGSIVRWLARSREEKPGQPTEERCRMLLQEVALAMQNHDKGRQVQASRRWAAEQISGEFPGGRSRDQIAAAEAFLEQAELDTGIVVKRGGELRFWHLTFQEYLAARAIAARSETEQVKILSNPNDKMLSPEWREVMLLLAGVLHEQGRQKVDGLVNLCLERSPKSAKLGARARTVGLVSAIVRDLSPFAYDAGEQYARLLDDVKVVLTPEGSKRMPVQERIEVADAVSLDQGEPFVTIAAGSFMMGAQKSDRKKPNFDPEAFDDEAPVHEVELDAYRIGRFPVTVGEYARFVEDGGYEDERWWEAGGFGDYTLPEEWEAQVAFPNRPVVGVSWHEASAYAASVGGKLPSEAEWERTARGKEGRKFPWGNEAADPSRLNYSESRVGHATPIGVYPLGATPEGVQDMAGNVWEWCSDEHVGYERSPGGVGRVLRGGSWHLDSRIARCAYRLWDLPGLRSGDIGFRVLLSVGVRTRNT